MDYVRKKVTPSAKKVSTKNRDIAKNRQKAAPFGRYEDMSPKRASSASKSAVKKAAAEGPKKRVPANPYKETWRPASKASEGPKKRMKRGK
jgi:hypothetical protein